MERLAKSGLVSRGGRRPEIRSSILDLRGGIVGSFLMRERRRGKPSPFLPSRSSSGEWVPPNLEHKRHHFGQIPNIPTFE